MGALLVVAWLAAGCAGSVPVDGSSDSTAATASTSGASSTSTTSTTGTSTTTTTTTQTVTPLTLQGTPATSVIAGVAYSFQPTVSASTTVSYSISNQPTWATFNASTGALSGTPAVADVGTTSNIIITASNGTSSASIGPFAIAVTAGSATLTWVAPVANTDGSILNNLVGYHIYYGTSATALTTQISVSGPSATTYVVSGLGAGTYYFAVTAYSSAGTESAQSDVGSKTI